MNKSASLIGAALMVFGLGATALAADMPQSAGSHASRNVASCARHHKAAHKSAHHRAHRARKTAHR